MSSYCCSLTELPARLISRQAGINGPGQFATMRTDIQEDQIKHARKLGWKMVYEFPGSHGDYKMQMWVCPITECRVGDAEAVETKPFRAAKKNVEKNVVKRVVVAKKKTTKRPVRRVARRAA